MNKSPLNASIVKTCCHLICSFSFSPAETDARFRLTEDLLDAEREFLVSLRTIYDVYARPLRKLCSISDEEQKQLFGGVEPVLSVSNMLLTKVWYQFTRNVSIQPVHRHAEMRPAMSIGLD